MVKIERTPTAPASLALESTKANGSYSKPDVWEQLREDFHGKCYICENDKATSVEIEHLVPHKGNKELKFDWNNLFFSCAHCNSMKNKSEYDGKILDCCQKEPERYLRQSLLDGHVSVVPQEGYGNDETVLQTAKLITECFECKNTGARIYESKVILDELSETMNVLYRALAAYKVEPDGKPLRTLRAMLKRSYKFSGFSRTYVRTHLDEYPSLEEYVRLEEENKDDRIA